MIRWLALALLMAAPARAEDAATNAARAAGDLQAAIAAMEQATGARDRVAALTGTIRAFEEGLDALREGLRQATIREAALALQFEAKRGRVAQLIGVLSTLETDPGPLLLLHPTGALGTARSGLMLAEIAPALQAEAEALRAQLAEVRDLRAAQAQAGTTLSAGLRGAQEARTLLSQAISDRTDLPTRLVDDPDTLAAMLASAQTLEDFAAALPPDAGPQGQPDFAAAKGNLPAPVLGTILRRPDEADAAGIRRPGVLLATRPRALVTAPWPATIRYRGPLLDYGNVMILEPGGGYLMIVAGLDTVYGDAGDIIAAGAPIGLMGGSQPGADEFLVAVQQGGGSDGTETLYLELRQGADPVDPTAWFTGMQEQDDSR